MADNTDEDDMSLRLTVDGGDLNRSSVSQRGPYGQRAAQPMLSDASTMSTMSSSISDVSSRTIVIEGVSKSNEESLEDRLESKKKGGGRLESFERDRLDPRNMVAVFAHSAVAENMLRLGSVTIGDVTMKLTSPTSMQLISPTGSQSGFEHLRGIHPVSRNISVTSLMSEPPSVDVSVSDESMRTVVIKDVPDKYKSSLNDFLCNPKNGGGRLVSFNRDRSNSKNIVAVFAHQKVAENILSLGAIEIIDVKMAVGRPGSSSSDDNQDLVSDTIKVFNIPPQVTENMLSLYFTIKRRSGGGPIREIQMKPDRQQAKIVFENASDAVEVSKRGTHQLSGAVLDVLLLESVPAAEGSGSGRAIRVSGIDRYKLSQEVLTMYFENAGNDADVTDFNFLDRDVAVITFATPEAVQHVLSKRNHMLENIQLHVEAMTPSSPPPVYACETERNRLIVKGLAFGITLVKLSEFVEREAGCGVTGWVLGSKKDSAMLEFDGEPDYAALRRLANSVPFSGRMVRIQKVPLATWVQVDALSKEDSDKSIASHFEEKCGAKRGAIQFHRQTETSGLLRFPQHSAVVTVISRNHILKGHTLTLSLFSKELGCVLPEKVSKDPPDNWIPKVAEVVGSPEQLDYIQRNLQIRERVQRSIEEVNCDIAWPSNVDGVVKLRQISRSESDDHDWSDLCTGAFTSLLSDIITRKLVAAPEVWQRLKDQVAEQTGEVDVKYDVVSSEMVFTGFRDPVWAYEKKMKALKDEVEKQLKREEERKRRKKEVLTTLRPPQIRYFQECGVADEVTKRFVDLSLRVDKDGVQLEAAEEILTDVKLFIYDSINTIESRFVDLSQDLTELISSEPTKTYVNDYLKENGIRAIIEEPPHGKSGVTVHAIGHEEILKAVTFLTTDFVSVPLELNDAARHAMRSPDWGVLVESFKRDYRFFSLRLSDDALVVSSRKDLVEGISGKIREVFKKHVTVEHFVSMKSSNVQLIETFKKSDIETLDKKLNASAMGGKLKQVLTPGDTSGFALKGNPDEVEAAKKQLEVMVRSATEAKREISRPGVFSLTETPEWKEFLETTQQNHLVMLKTMVTNPYVSSGSSNVKCGPRHEMVVNGHSIEVVLGDITDIQPGGALINPTNPRLELSRGLGAEIVKMGGETIQKECTNHIKNSGNLPPGSVFVSEAGQMLCDVIIHVVEPTTFDDQTINVYQSAIKKALEAALASQSKFVAFPLSFGAAFKRELLFAAVKEFFEKPESAVLKSVQFVDDDVDQVKKIEEQLKNFEISLTSTAVPGFPHASAPHPPTPSSPTELTHTTPEGINVKFYKGTICALKVDVMVNSTAKNLVLSSGGVSKAILASAGPEIQTECQQKSPNGLSQFGEILATKAYKLSCKAVYHGAAVQWDNGAGPAEKVLRTFTSNALNMAHRQNMKSIAIPAIGSGTLKVPHDVVTNVLMDEIFKFSKTNRGTPLQTIYTVAYEQNLPSVAAFEKKFMSLQPVPSTAPIKRPVSVGQTRGLRIYEEKLTISVNALSSSTAQLVLAETSKFIADASDKRSFETKLPFTDEQLDRIDFLQVVHLVRITLSNGKIDVEGSKEDIANAMDKIKFILKDS